MDKCPPLGTYPYKSPHAKIRMQKPQSGGKFSVQIPGGAWGMLWQKLIAALLFCARREHKAVIHLFNVISRSTFLIQECYHGRRVP